MLRRRGPSRPAWTAAGLAVLLSVGAAPGLHPHPLLLEGVGVAMAEVEPAESGAGVDTHHVCLLCLVYASSSLMPAISPAQAPGSVLLAVAMARPRLGERPDLPRQTGRAPPEPAQS